MPGTILGAYNTLEGEKIHFCAYGAYIKWDYWCHWTLWHAKVGEPYTLTIVLNIKFLLKIYTWQQRYPKLKIKKSIKTEC